MSIKTIFKSTVLVMALMCLTFVTASAQNEVVKTFLFSTATRDDQGLSLSMTDPDDNTTKIVISASGNRQQQGINGSGTNSNIRLLNKTNAYVGSTGADVEFIISPYVNGKVTKIEFTNARRTSVQTETCDKHFSMSINGMKYNGTDDALTGDGSSTENASFTFLSTNNQGVAGNLSLILGAGSSFFLNQGCKMIVTYIPNVAPTHKHNFSFNAVGNTLTATCAHDDGLECSLAETNYQTTLTLTAKSGAYGDYVYHSATHNLSGFNAKTGLNATTNGVVHTNKNDNTTSTSPVNAIGEYTATLVVTIGNNNYTLSTEFSIYNNIVDYTNNYPNLLDCPTYGFTDGDYPATITFHPINGISIRTLTITGANTNLSIGNGITDNGDNTYSFTSPREDATIDATFEAPITINCKNGGSVSASVGENTNITTAQVGETVTLTATPDEGYTVTKVHVYNGNDTYNVIDNGDGTYSFTMPASAVTVEVEFSKTIGALTISYFGDRTTATINGNYTADDALLTLTEEIAVTSVTFDRTFTPGATSTIILPFAVESGNYEGGTFYEFTSVDYKNDKWVASLTKVAGNIEAHKPYLYMPSDDKLTIKGGVTFNATSAEEYKDEKGDWTFKGVFKKKDWETGVRTDYFFASTSATSTEGNAVNAGDFVRIGNECHLSPFRCYLSYSVSGSEQSLLKSAKELPSSIEVRLIDEVASVVEPDDNPSESGEVITPVSEITPNSGIKVWSFDGTIFIEAQPNMDYTIVDLNGRTLKNGVTNSTREEVTLSRAAGIVIVKIGNKTFKVQY